MGSEAKAKTFSNRAVYEYAKVTSQREFPQITSPTLSATGPHFLSTLIRWWRERYYRRWYAIMEETDGLPLADTKARGLLITRIRARNALHRTLPDWSPAQKAEAESYLTKAKLDVSTLLEIPSYGPSFFSLWADAKKQGLSDEDTARHIWHWANDPPYAWTRDDERRAQGLPAIEPRVTKRLAEVTVWRQTGDWYTPWDTEVAGHHWQVRLNDFPDEWMYSLLIDGELVGDFHDWPEAWDRGEARPESEARKVAIAVRKVANVDEKTLLRRYRNREYEEVWRDLMALGPDVRDARYKSAAWAVARETMRRAGKNVKLLAKRLKKLDYRFVAMPGQVSRPCTEEERRLFRAWERRRLWMPLSLRAWVEEVGWVDFVGSHPALGPVDAHGEPLFRTDPLAFYGTMDIEAILQEWMRPSPADREPTEWEISCDAKSKAGLVTDEEPSGGYAVQVPNLAADAVLDGEPHGITFVEYLRLSFQWGGFPGWEKYEKRPELELAFLRDGLLPL
jgi:hypothetical protein